jgi:DNA polymerase III delta subunit
MLKVFVGKSKKVKDAQDIKWESIGTEELLSLASSQNMFGGKETYVLAGAINSDRQDEFLGIAKELVESPNTFIFEEEKLLKGPTTALEKVGAEITIEKRPAAAAVRGFDPFGLTFAFAARDRKKLWLGLMQAFKAGEKAEAVAGLLNWKVRQELERATGAKREQLINLSRQLVYMYHDSHRGAGDLELLLERFALRL